MGAHRIFFREGQGLGTMASAEREPITGVWDGVPAGSRGIEPLVGVGGGQSPLKLKALKHLHT